MDNQISSSDTQTLRSVQDLLREEWEPVEFGAPAEDCAAQVLHRAQRRDSAEKIAAYLTKVETEEVGLVLAPGVEERNLEVARRAIEIVESASA